MIPIMWIRLDEVIESGDPRFLARCLARKLASRVTLLIGQDEDEIDFTLEVPGEHYKFLTSISCLQQKMRPFMHTKKEKKDREIEKMERSFSRE